MDQTVTAAKPALYQPSEAAIAHLCGAVQCATVSAEDDAEVNWQEFEKLHAFLETSYPLIHKTMEREVVARGSLLDRLLLRCACLLAQSRKGVKLPQKTNHRAALSKGSGKGRLDAGQVPLYPEPLLLQRPAKRLGGKILMEANLRVLPQRIAQSAQLLPALLNRRQCPLLLLLHFYPLLSP